MKTRIILLMCLLTGGTLQAQEYLREVLDKLESIRSASYQEERFSYLPYETKPKASYTYQVHEYRNPNDTTIGSSFVEWTKGEKIARRIYDGRIQAYIDQEPKEVEINDFSMYPFPYRPVGAPFFNYTESLLRYFLTSSDSITREVKDMDSLYYVKWLSTNRLRLSSLAGLTGCLNILLSQTLLRNMRCGLTRKRICLAG